jgi:hypothetical protein
MNSQTGTGTAVFCDAYYDQYQKWPTKIYVDTNCPVHQTETTGMAFRVSSRTLFTPTWIKQLPPAHMACCTAYHKEHGHWPTKEYANRRLIDTLPPSPQDSISSSPSRDMPVHHNPGRDTPQDDLHISPQHRAGTPPPIKRGDVDDKPPVKFEDYGRRGPYARTLNHQSLRGSEPRKPSIGMLDRYKQTQNAAHGLPHSPSHNPRETAPHETYGQAIKSKLPGQ